MKVSPKICRAVCRNIIKFYIVHFVGQLLTKTSPSHTVAGTNVGTVPVMFKILMWVSTSPHLQTVPTHSFCQMKCLHQDISTATFQRTLIKSNTISLHLCVSVAIYFKWNEQSRSTFKITYQIFVLVTENCILAHCADFCGLDEMGIWCFEHVFHSQRCWYLFLNRGNYCSQKICTTKNIWFTGYIRSVLMCVTALSQLISFPREAMTQSAFPGPDVILWS